MLFRKKGHTTTCIWLEKYDKPAPIEFEVLRKLVSDNKPLDKAISDLLAHKPASLEKVYAPAEPVINAFIESELERLKSYCEKSNERSIGFDALNKLFLEVLEAQA